MRETFQLENHPSPLHQFLNKHGRLFQAQALPKWVEKGEPKECFSNAAQLSVNHGFDYAEGLAVRPSLGIPIHHAWALDDYGRVIDNTWNDPEHCLYFGVLVDRSTLIDGLLETGVYGLLDIGRGFNFDFAERVFGWKACSPSSGSRPQA